MIIEEASIGHNIAGLEAVVGMSEVQILKEIYDHRGVVLDYKTWDAPQMSVTDNGVRLRFKAIILLVKNGIEYDVLKIQELDANITLIDGEIDIEAIGDKVSGYF